MRCAILLRKTYTCLKKTFLVHKSDIFFLSFYADDTFWYCYSSKCSKESRKEDLLRIAVWLKRLTSPCLSAVIANYSIPQLYLVRWNFNYLGVTLTSNFTWADHIDYVASKINQPLGILRRIKPTSA